MAGLQVELARLRGEARLKEVRRSDRAEKLLDPASGRSPAPN
jgi:hypothetical protein